MSLSLKYHTLVLLCMLGLSAQGAQINNKSQKPNPLVDHNFCMSFWSVVDTYYPSIDTSSVENSDLVLFFGGTGAGKTTTINYFLGHEMGKLVEKEGGFGPPKIEVVKALNNVPVAKIGHNKFISETTEPKLFKSHKTPYYFLDCPGFADSRGDDQEYFNILVIRAFIEKCKSVKAVFCVVAYDTITQNRGKAFSMLGRQMSYTMDVARNIENIFWTFTKTPERYEQCHLIKDLKEVKASKETVRAKLANKLKDKWESVWASKPEKMDYDMLSSLLECEENIQIISPLDGGSSARKLFDRLRLTKKTIPKEDFIIEKVGEKDLIGLMRGVYMNKKDVMSDYRLISPIVSSEEEIKRLKEEIIEMDSTKEEIVKYRSLSRSLSCRFFNSTATFKYNDLPFEKDRLINNHTNVTQKIKKSDASKGIFESEYVLKGDWDFLTSKSGSAAAIFYVKKKYIQKEKRESAQKNLALLTQGLKQNVIKEKREVLEKNKNHLAFIAETYPFLSSSNRRKAQPKEEKKEEEKKEDVISIGKSLLAINAISTINAININGSLRKLLGPFKEDNIKKNTDLIDDFVEFYKNAQSKQDMKNDDE